MKETEKKYINNNLAILLSYNISLAAPFGTPVHILLCCIFPCIGYTITFQLCYSFFVLVLYSKHRILFLSSSDTPSLVISFLLHLTHCTFVIPLHIIAFSSLLQGNSYIIYFLVVLQRQSLISGFPLFLFSCICTLYTPQRLLLPILSSTPFLLVVTNFI